MKTTPKVLLTAVAGTTGMTIYSYLLSKKRNREFREPQILNALIDPQARKPNGRPDNKKLPIKGFLLHYGAGIVFSSYYHLLWKKRIKVHPVISGAGFGLSCGLIGISIWKGIFKLNQHPPKIDLNLYLRHLLAAHTVFGISLSLAAAQIGDTEKE